MLPILAGAQLWHFRSVCWELICRYHWVKTVLLHKQMVILVKVDTLKKKKETGSKTNIVLTQSTCQLIKCPKREISFYLKLFPSTRETILTISCEVKLGWVWAITFLGRHGQGGVQGACYYCWQSWSIRSSRRLNSDLFDLFNTF